MDKQIKRPFFLAGLIINIVAFIVIAITCFITIFEVAEEISDTVSLQTRTIVKMLFSILILACCISGAIFSAVCITRTNNSVELFSKKKGFVITCIAIDALTILFSIVALAVDKFEVLLFIMLLAVICAGVFITLDFVKNEKLNKPAKSELENVEQNEVQVQPSEQADEKQTSEAEKPEETSSEPSETKE